MQHSSLFPALAAALLMPLAAAADEVTINTALGEATVESSPATIAVFDIAAIDTLDALGVQIDGVPGPIYLERLTPVAEAAVQVGSLFEPDYEALANLTPDLIIAGGRSAAVVPDLGRIAPVIDMTIGGDLVADARARTLAYGAIFGLEDRAEALVADLDARIAEVAATVEGRGNALIVLTNGGQVSAYGVGSRFGWIHEALGLPEAVPGVETRTHGEAISFEFIAEANPDWLIVVDRGAAVGQEGESARATLDNPLVTGTTAWSAGQVIQVDPAEIYISGGGYGAIMRVADQIGAAFAGE
ncbi:MAG: siderophore ABC transporter substrate-binding protein [Rubellimicrobium sp.]|nr:siderophore ABC transporter substrate-binding protein [Rubellimicrobium sp.]